MTFDSLSRKVFAGPRLKRLRRERRLTQARMADELDVSPSYLNLMESNQRPITVPVLIRLTEVYGVDPRDFIEIEGEQSVGDIEQILADPLFRDDLVPRQKLRHAAETSPELLGAMLKLYRAYVRVREANDSRPDQGRGASPLDRVRAILYDARNHFPDIDAGAESFVAGLSDAHGLYPALAERLRARHGVRVRPTAPQAMGDRLRWYDHQRKHLMISEALDPPGRTFQAAYQLGLFEFGKLFEETSAQLERADGAARKLLRVTLANYFAGAVMMPYGRFYEAAELAAYDVELLAARFGASYEQVAHRLTTLARSSARGVPFFMMRVDIAGNVSKRLSSGRFPFADSGGSCALWNVHASFAQRGRILTQVIELTDGGQWFTIARAGRGALAPWGAIQPQFAIALGCELKFARRLVYAQRLDLDALEPTPVGLACRLCERPNCPQRAAPPALRAPLIDETTLTVTPFPFKDA